jgi:hypothetical protein
MDTPQHISEIIDQALAKTLAAAGDKRFAALLRQTYANRTRIRIEVEHLFGPFYDAALVRIVHVAPGTDPADVDVLARVEAQRYVHESEVRLIRAEAKAFRERVRELLAKQEFG